MKYLIELTEEQIERMENLVSFTIGRGEW